MTLQNPVLADQIDTGAQTLETPPESRVLAPGNEGARLRNLPWLRTLQDPYVDAASRALRKSSVEVARFLEGNPEFVYDLAVIGAGPHGISAMYEGRGRSTICIEAGDCISANFGRTGDLFRVNTASRAEDGRPVALGEGNLNQLGGPIKPPDLSGQLWFEAKVIASATTCNALEAGGDAPPDILFGKHVTAMTTERDEATGREYVSLALNSGSPDALQVRARKVIVATGLGEPKVPLPDDAGGKLIKREIERFESLDLSRTRKAPGIMTIDQAFRLAAAQIDGRAPYYQGGTVVVGFGDSAKTFLEYLYGLGPETAYRAPNRISCAQQGTAAPSTWIVGADGPETCWEYIAGHGAKPGTDARYAALSTSLQKNIALKRGRLVAISARALPIPGSGGFELKVQGKNGQIDVIDADRVILATGYRNPLLERAAAGEIELQDVHATLHEGRRAVVGQQVDGQQIYAVGPAAGTGFIEGTGRPAENCCAPRPNSPVSLFKTIPNTQALVREQIATFTEPPVRRPRQSSSPPRLELRSDRKEERLKLASKPAAVLHPDAENLILAYVAGAVEQSPLVPGGEETKGSAAGGSLEFDLSFHVAGAAPSAPLHLRSRQLTLDSLRRIGERLERDPEVLGYLHRFAARTSRGELKLSFQAPDGITDIGRMQRTY